MATAADAANKGAAGSGTKGAASSGPKGVEEDFRHLMAVLEAERLKADKAEERMARERHTVLAEVERLRQTTAEWCFNERAKTEAEWKRLDKLTEEMAALWPSASRDMDVVEINCSGQLFSVPRGLLCSMEGSSFSRLFSKEFAGEIPRDEQGRLLLDFNSHCFRIVVEHLQNRRLNPGAPLPVVPAGLQQSMELLSEAWGLAPFVLENRLDPVHATSLRVAGEVIRATLDGWQLISSQHPLPLYARSFFEARVLENPDPRGGLAVGVCGHVVQGSEAHNVSPQGSVVYTSGNGLVGDCVEGAEDVKKGVALAAGTRLGVRHDPRRGSLEWYCDGELLGECRLKPEWRERMRLLHAVFGLYLPGQVIEVDFHAVGPAQSAAEDAAEARGAAEAPGGGAAPAPAGAAREADAAEADAESLEAP